MNRESISDSGRCSKISRRNIEKLIVAVVNAAAILFVLVSVCAYGRAADASVKIDGMAEWLTESAERSLEAVYDHIPAAEPRDIKEELLRVVADRLLLGYSVESVTFTGRDDVVIKLKLTRAAPEWEVQITPPVLSPPVDGWFASDTAGMPDEILSLIKGVPIEVLSWGDMDLKKAVESFCAERIPGWRITLMARHKLEGGVILDVSFIPEQPLALAVTTRINSSSIPAILHSNLEKDLLKGFAPVIGIPVPWLDKHADNLTFLGRDVLREESLVRISKADPIITANTGVVSNVDVELESRSYAGRLWMAVYAGAEDRYPEVGVHLGRRMQILPRWDMELYGELILQLSDWDLETRLGLRWSLWRNIWIGGEWSNFDDIWWGRLDFESWARRPYAWVRYSEESDVSAALGYHISDYISIEIHYDSRFDDAWNVRAVLSL